MSEQIEQRDHYLEAHHQLVRLVDRPGYAAEVAEIAESEIEATTDELSKENEQFLISYFGNDRQFFQGLRRSSERVGASFDQVVSAMQVLGRLDHAMLADHRESLKNKFKLDFAQVAQDFVAERYTEDDIETFGAFLAPPSFMGRDQLIWLVDQPESVAIADQLQAGGHQLQIGTKEVVLRADRFCVQFLRGLILTAQRERIDPTRQFGRLVTIYQQQLNNYLEEGPQQFDTCLYIRDRIDTQAFGERLSHRAIYSSYTEKLEVMAPDISRIESYISEHPDEQILIYLGGHGTSGGVLQIDGAQIEARQLDSLASYPNVRLVEIDSCFAEQSVRSLSTAADLQADILAASWSGKSNGGYDTTKLGSFDRHGYSDQIPGPLLSSAQLHGLEQVYLFGENLSTGGWSLSSILPDEIASSLIIADGKKLPLERNISSQERKERLLSLLQRYPGATVSFDRGDVSCQLKSEQLARLLQLVPDLEGDYDGDGQVSFAEHRVYLLQRYHQSFLPTSYLHEGARVELSRVELSRDRDITGLA